MVRQVRVVSVSSGGHLDALVRRIQAIQESGPVPTKILLVSASNPHKEIQKAFDHAGIRDVMVLDMLSTMLGAAPQVRPTNAVFVPAPTMLELTAMRVEQVHRMLGGDAHIIIDSLDTLARYNPRKTVEEFTHYLVNRLRSMGASGDLFVTDSPDGLSLSESVRPYTDGHITTEA